MKIRQARGRMIGRGSAVQLKRDNARAKHNYLTALGFSTIIAILRCFLRTTLHLFTGFCLSQMKSKCETIVYLRWPLEGRKIECK